jgi:hypothetical protein
MRRFKARESSLDLGQSGFGHEVAMKRYRPVRKSGFVAVCFPYERAAHCERSRAEYRFDLSASILIFPILEFGAGPIFGFPSSSLGRRAEVLLVISLLRGNRFMNCSSGSTFLPTRCSGTRT